MICRLLGHFAIEPHFQQGGFEFTRCARCGEDLFRHPGAEWRLLVSRVDDGAPRPAERYRSPAGRVPPRHHSRANPDAGYDLRQRGKAAGPGKSSGSEATATGRDALSNTGPGNRAGVGKTIVLPSPPKSTSTKTRDRVRRYRRWWLSRRERRGQGDVQ